MYDLIAKPPISEHYLGEKRVNYSRLATTVRVFKYLFDCNW